MAKQSGLLMIIIALLLVVLGGLASSFVLMMVSGSNSAISIISANNAYDLAATGLENGNYQLSLGTCSASWSSITTVSGQGEYQYSCSQNQASTTIASSLTAISTSIPLASAANVANFGALTIDSEIIFYDGISGNTLLNAQRGQNGTSAATHTLGASARQLQYTIVSQGGAPSLSAPNGQVTLTQTVLLASGGYYAVGTQGGNGVILNYNGSSWSTMLSVSGVSFRGVETSINYGLAVGYDSSNTGYIYQFNGSSWSFLGSVSNANFLAVSCDLPNSPSLCWVAGQAQSPKKSLLYYTGTGTPYTSGSLGNVAVSAVSCMNDLCIATLSGNVVDFAINSTNPFATVSNIGGTINGINCVQANSCVLVRSNGSVYYFNGSSWSGFNISSRSLNEVHCPSTSTCFVVGNNGVIFNCSLPITSKASCVAQTTPGTLNLLGIRCNAINDCVAVGAGTLAYRYTGQAWTAISLPNTLYSISGVGSSGGTMVTPTMLHNQ